MRKLRSIWTKGAITLVMVSLIGMGSTRLWSAQKEAKKHGYLGVVTQELSRHQKKALKADFGVVITDIDPDSPADRDGLMEDDVIQYVNDKKITRTSTLARVIRAMNPGEKAKLVVIRDGKQKTITVTVGRARREESYAFSFMGPRNLFHWHKINRGFLGVQIHAINEDLAPYFGVRAGEGVLILEVAKNSPAEKAGLKSGDVIVKIDDEPVSRPKDVYEIISEFDEEDEVTIEIIRQNKNQTYSVKLEERSFDEGIMNFPQRMIREFRRKEIPDKSVNLWLLETPEVPKDREIIIEREIIGSGQTI